MRKYFNLFLCLLFLSFISDTSFAKSKKKTAKTPPFEVHSELNVFGSFGVTVTSLIDGLSVQDIILNNGRCGITSDVADSYFGETLNYGESRFFLSDCPGKLLLIKATIVTNAGSWSYNLRRPYEY